MIDGGCNVNGTCPAWKSAYQPTALAYAVWGNQLDAIKLLLDSGADPDRVDGVRARSPNSGTQNALSSCPHSTDSLSSPAHGALVPGRKIRVAGWPLLYSIL